MMRLLSVVLLSLGAWVSPVAAQGFGSGFSFGKGGAGNAGPEISAFLVPTETPDILAVQVKIVIPPGGNTYSQDPEFAKPTEIAVNALPGWSAVDAAFFPDHAPKREFDENFGKPVEKFTGTIVFSQRFKVPAGTNPQSTQVKGTAKLLVCVNGLCQPNTLPFETTYAAKNITGKPFPPVTAAPVAVVGEALSPQAFGYEITPKRKRGDTEVPDPIRLQFELSPKNARPGDTVTLAITMSLAPGWSTYGLQRADDSQPELPTEIKIETQNLKAVGEMTSVPPPTLHTTKLGDEIARSNAHKDRVTWKQTYTVTGPGYGLEGTIRYQICETGKACFAPNKIAFSLGSLQKKEHVAGAGTVVDTFADAGASKINNAAGDDFIEIPYLAEGKAQTLSGTLLGAFVAGLVMNLLPCVLPVLAIKILSLVQQAGESRARIMGLNLAYTAGVMSVFFALAVLSWGLGQSLASAFQNSAFMTFMACVVFVMGLSLFGVFELPVPGVLPSANDQHEGYFGAFNTGIIATILGTPCIGPLVSPFFAWTLAQSASVVFLVFGMMGLGMATPYLLTGIFPALVNWLPKPGMWMVRFKQFTGFVMMGTTIFLIFSIEKDWQVPVLILLLSLALLVWMSANLTSPAEVFSRRVRVYLMSLAVSAPVFLFGLRMITAEDTPGSMPWIPYSEPLITELRKEGRPMLIDFTANWCVNCKVNERVALNREDTVNAVKEMGVTPILADFTHENDDIRRRLNQFDQDSVPLTVIVPPGKDSQAIALRGLYTKRQLLAILNSYVAPNGVDPVAEAPQGSHSVGMTR